MGQSLAVRREHILSFSEEQFSFPFIGFAFRRNSVDVPRFHVLQIGMEM